MLGLKCILSCSKINLYAPQEYRYGDSAPPYLNVRDFLTVLSFKYLMITGGGSQMITPDHRGGRGGLRRAEM